MFFRPKPKFQPGELVLIPLNSVFNEWPGYMLIKQRRWVRHYNDTKKQQKQWVYDGQIFLISEEKLAFFTNGFGYREISLIPISNLEYSSLGYIQS
jgi:hypothetical protein